MVFNQVSSPGALGCQTLTQYDQVGDHLGIREGARWQPNGGDQIRLLVEMGADRLRCWRIERVARGDEGEDSAQAEFGQRLDEEVVVDRAREKPLRRL